MNTAADLLDNASFDAGLGLVVWDFASVGCNSALASDVAAIGGNTATGRAGFMGAATVEDAVQTGLAGDAGDMLVGGAGVDTLGDVAACMIGGTTLADIEAPLATGIDMLLGAGSEVEAASSAQDLRAAAILQRIVSVSLAVPTVLGLAQRIRFLKRDRNLRMASAD